MARLFALFILVPLVELYLLVWLGGQLGFFNTVVLVLLTGMLGAALAKWEGQRVWRAWQNALGRGEMPEEGVLGGLLLLVGAVFLITPGVLTDTLGLFLLLPTTRGWLVNRLRPSVRRYVEQSTRQGQATISVVRMGSPSGFPFQDDVGQTAPGFRNLPIDSGLGPGPARGHVLDADFEVEELD